jgi:hypothetical protein
MSIHPQEIAIILNLCPICPDIQYKILMLIIGMTGTPTSNLFKAPTIFTFYAGNKKKFNYSTRPLIQSAYFRDLVLLANYKFSHYSSDDETSDEEEEPNDEEDIPNATYEAYYETKMAYAWTYTGTSGNEYIIDCMVQLKEITKLRLNKMIATEPIIEII